MLQMCLHLLLYICVMIGPASAARRANTGNFQAADHVHEPAQCIVTAALGPPWQPSGSSNHLQQITLTITNAAESKVPAPYSLAVANPAYRAASQAFQWVVASETAEVGGVISGMPMAEVPKPAFRLPETLLSSLQRNTFCLSCLRSVSQAAVYSQALLVRSPIGSLGCPFLSILRPII